MGVFAVAVCVLMVTGAFGLAENLPVAAGEATAKSVSCECEVFAQQVDSNAFQTVSVHHSSSARVQHPHSATRADNARKHAQLFALGSTTALDSFSAQPATQSPPVATPQQEAPPEQQLKQDYSEEGWMRIGEGKWSEPLVVTALRRHRDGVVLPMGAIATSMDRVWEMFPMPERIVQDIMRFPVALQRIKEVKGVVVPEMDDHRGRRKIRYLPVHPDCEDAMVGREAKWDRLEAEVVAKATSTS